MQIIIRQVLRSGSMLIAALLVACNSGSLTFVPGTSSSSGGGSSSGGSSGGSSGSSSSGGSSGGQGAVAHLALTSSATSLPSNATTQATGITIIATTTDANNNPVSGVVVLFNADSGTLIPNGNITGANGQQQSVLTTGGNPTLRTIHVSATAGSITSTPQSIAITVVVPSGVQMGIMQGHRNPTRSDNLPGRFNTPGNILIADQFNNRVIELDKNNNIVWTFGDLSSTAGPTSVVAPNDAERVGSFTLITGTGAPVGAEPMCPDGCQDNRVILVNEKSEIVWQYGRAGVAGAGFNQLNAPVFSTTLPNGHVLIADQGNQRVIEVNASHGIVWQYGTTGASGVGANQLNNPNSAEPLENGDILIADEANNRVIEVDCAKNIVWQYGSPDDTTTLNGAAFASRLANGNTLITDSNNNRVVEVNTLKKVVFTYTTNTRSGSVSNPNPTRAVRLRSGNTLISDQFNDQIIEIDPSGTIQLGLGQIGIAGIGSGLLNAPYDAKVIGDYTGLTRP